jgi:hypothetical protein
MTHARCWLSDPAGLGGTGFRSACARLFTVFTAVLALAFCLRAQQAKLPRKGRQPDRTTPPAAEPLRRLPRKTAGPPAAAPQSPNLLQQFIERQRAQLRQLPQSEDRLRPLVLGAVTPLRELVDQVWIRVLPIAPPILPAAAPPPVPTVAAQTIPNRWRIFPAPPWRRYDNASLDAVYADSHWWDPFNRGTLKGDFPFAGRRLFFTFKGSSETLAEDRRLPVPAGASSTDPGESNFFGRGGQFAVAQDFRFSFDLFEGSAGFRPVDWEIRVTPEVNVNYLLARENGVTDIDVGDGIRRTDAGVNMQELFFEKRLFTNSTAAFEPRKQEDDRGSAYFDFTSLRLGIQRFTSDFRGFVFSDEQPGARLFGTFHNNVFQYNLAYFNMLEKDTNSGLNRFERRHQSVYAANLYWNDFLTKGYNINFSALYNNDQPSYLIDKDGFLVRPAPIGLPELHKVRVGYAGITGDGHIGRINVSDAYYEAFGRDSFNPIPASRNAQHIEARMAALELAYEKDWMTWKISGFYASGDGNLNDGRATGFDGIVPNQQFAGGGFLGNPALADRGLLNNEFEGGGINFLNREAVPLSGTGVFLFGPNSLMPTMRAGLFEGQANFVNPGILLYNAGFDAKITPKLKSSLNVNWARFDRTEVLQAVLFQGRIRNDIGLDSGLGLQYRPLLSENIVVTAGFGALAPGAGFGDIYSRRTLFSAFLNLRLVF